MNPDSVATGLHVNEIDPDSSVHVNMAIDCCTIDTMPSMAALHHSGMPITNYF